MKNTLHTPVLIFAVLLHLGVAAVGPDGRARADSEALFDDSTTVTELLAGARGAFGMDEFPIAELYYKEVLRREPSHVQAMLELANVYERNGKLEYARGVLTRALSIHPDDPDIRTRRENVERTLLVVLKEEADGLLAEGRFEEALPRLSLQVNISPGNAGLLYRRAQCLAELGRRSLALADLDVALTIDPLPEYYELRAAIIAKRRAEKTGELRARVEKLLGADTPGSDEEALDLLGQFLASEPDAPWARDLYRSLTNVRAEDVDSTSVLSVIRHAASASGHFVQAHGVKLARFIDRHVAWIIALLITYLIFRSPFADAISTRLSRPRALSGQLSVFSLHEVLLMINGEAQTGVLHLQGGSTNGRAYFHNGEPCHCVSGKIEGAKALRALLRDSRTGRFSFSPGGLSVKRSIDTPLELFLVEAAPRSTPPLASMPKSMLASTPESTPADTPDTLQPAKSRFKKLLERRSE